LPKQYPFATRCDQRRGELRLALVFVAGVFLFLDAILRIAVL